MKVARADDIVKENDKYVEEANRVIEMIRSENRKLNKAIRIAIELLNGTEETPPTPGLAAEVLKESLGYLF